MDNNNLKTFVICFTISIIIGLTLAAPEPAPSINVKKSSISLSPEEKLALDQFRELAANIIRNNKHMQTDSYLIRWVRDQNLDAKKAYTKFSNYIEYRKSKNLDEIINEDMSDIRKFYPFDISGRDQDGRPVLSWPLGSWDLRKAVLANKLERISRYVDYMIESTAIAARNSKTQSGQSLSQAVIIMDLTGFNLRQHGCISCLSIYFDMISKLENNYPQSIKSFNIINTPKVFSSIMDLVLPSASQSTRDVLKVFGFNKAEWSKELLETISADQLNRKYGGTKSSY